MSWIKTIAYEKAGPALKRAFDRIKGPNNYIDNVFRVHSLRPRSLTGHMHLYKNTLHNPDNTLPKWYLEAIGVYISHLNGCDYCFQHHKEGFRQLYPETKTFPQFLNAIEKDSLETVLEGKFLLGMDYARRLTLDMRSLTGAYIQQMREAGFTDGEILELNQVIGYFNYGNRTSMGLGVNTKGDILGPILETDTIGAPKKEQL